MARPRSVTIRLRAGVARALAPDNRSMKQGVNYTLTWEDFERISGNARKNVIEVVSFNTTAGARTSDVDLTLNSATLPAGKKVGAVAEGVQENDRFVLVKNVGPAVTAGSALVFSDVTKREVTATHTASTATAKNFAGVSLGAIGTGNFGWVQNDGEITTVLADTDVAAGDPVVLHPTTAGTVTGVEENEVQTLTQTGATAGTFTLTFDGQTTGAIAFNASAAAVGTALEALSNIGVGDVVVSGGPLGTSAVTVGFAGALASRDVATLTANNTGMTGGTVVVATTRQGRSTAGSTSGVIGTALSNVTGGTVEVAITSSAGRARRHVKNSGRLF